MKINYTVRGVLGIAIAGALAAAVGGIAVGAVGESPGAVPYAPVDPMADARGFNVVVEGNARVTGNENEATMAIGGNLSIGGTYNVGNEGRGGFTFPGDAAATALVVGGRVNFADSVAGGVVRVLDNGYLKVGDVSNGDVLVTDANNALRDTREVPDGAGYDATPHVELTTRQPVASVSAATGLDFAALFGEFRARSAELAECENTVILRDTAGDPLPDQDTVPTQSNLRIELTEGVTNVLNITAENLANIASITYSPVPSADTPLLVNVDTTGVGDTFTWPVNTDNIAGPQAPYILWNFPTATSITMPESGADSLEGTLYAPNAHLTDLDSSNIEGDIVVAELTHGSATANGGEFHYFPFAATLDCGASPSPSPTVTTPTPTVTPTPTTVPIADGGLVVEKRADRTHADVGDIIDFTITARNVTDQTRAETLTDDLSDLLQFASVVGTPTASLPELTFDSPLLTWNGDLDPGESVTISYTVRATAEGEIHNVVTWPGGSECLEVWVWDRDRPYPSGEHHPSGRPRPGAHCNPGGNGVPEDPNHWHLSRPPQ
ncbi:putative repeat protein (TIGR01451 family)/choice-of-anchor A domain-containing protein [Actinocorallia herbida]|uniref:Putative repeat protein (TIGR01451 family)/choice-of-anchor A domain-containing protein n=1 Tax=Actinocorallia herbida TaxID=58109 RepID=A0A3N1D0D1_9ACTN|nr:collagen-binding domain-containing protein [Actinocorallia herbida]ROO86498.1 putative repeat protein (TIGR01451 family)/choice-of-anchor A domain-containing protein [Actinocorallia herbida]